MLLDINVYYCLRHLLPSHCDAKALSRLKFCWLDGADDVFKHVVVGDVVPMGSVNGVHTSHRHCIQDGMGLRIVSLQPDLFSQQTSRQV